MKNNHFQQTKLRVGILYGGKSAEHEISIQSAENVMVALDKDKFTPVLIGIDKHGDWHWDTSTTLLENTAAAIQTNMTKAVVVLPEQSLDIGKAIDSTSLDVIFPILHGPLGEDGSIQGLLEIANMPYVGCGVLSSAIAMDKDVSKRLLRAAGINVTDHVVLTVDQRSTCDVKGIIKTLGLPLFVKPANMGSSIGVSKVSEEKDLARAIDHAFEYDRKILIEKAVIGDEVECAVLGNEQPNVSVPGRIIPKTDYYTYKAKYNDEETILEIPAKLPIDVTQRVQSVALEAFKALCCEGMARVDMFVTHQGEVYVNEINTIPGFTKSSMYPQLWEASGLSYTALITRLIELAVERHEQRRHLQTSYEKA